MNKTYLIVPSITFAVKSEKILNKNNINCIIDRTPISFNKNGCSYSIIINNEDLQNAKSILLENKIIINGIETISGEIL